MAAFCHVTLAQGKAPAGSSYLAALRITHGCAGLPTTEVQVQIPPGFRGARPRPRLGWTVSVRREALAQPYRSHGREIREEVREVRWTADSAQAALADGLFDVFELLGSLPDQPGPMWFKLSQLCRDGAREARLDWHEVPAQGLSVQGLAAPAVPLLVEPAAHEAAHH